MKEQEVPELRSGQVWRSPRGNFYRVEEVTQTQPTEASAPQDGYRQAALRAGLEGTGRRIFRDARKTRGWQFVAPLVTPNIVMQAMEGALD